MITNNVTRLLQSRNIPFTIYELNDEKRGAMETATLLGVAPEMVYKTIVVLREAPGKKCLLCVIPGPNEVDLKAVAGCLGEKKVHLATQNEAEKITGLKTGGISPLALLNKGFQVILDESAQEQVEIHISGGQRNLNIRLPVKALVELTNARVSLISKPGTGEPD